MFYPAYHFFKQLLSFGGYHASALRPKDLKELLTAFSLCQNNHVVCLFPLINKIRDLEGDLVIDDTSNPKYGLKDYCKKMKLLTQGGYAYGFKIMLILWRCEFGDIPIALGFWHKKSPSLNELALMALSQLRNQIGLKPNCVLIDAAYASNKMFKRLDGYGWPCVTRFKKNRKIDNKNIPSRIPRAYGSICGYLNNGVKVKVFRRKQYYLCCNRMLWEVGHVVRLYKRRWKIEETFRALKQCLNLRGCKQRCMRIQALYVTMCVLLYHELTQFLDQSVYKTTAQVISGEIDFDILYNDRLSKLF